MASIAAILAVAAGSAFALEEAKDEKDKLKACEASLCELVKKSGFGRAAGILQSIHDHPGITY